MSESTSKTIYLYNPPLGPPLLSNDASSSNYNIVKPSISYDNGEKITINGVESSYGKTIKISSDITPDYYDKYIDAFNKMAESTDLDTTRSMMVIEVPNDAYECENLIFDSNTDNSSKILNAEVLSETASLNDYIKKSAILIPLSTSNKYTPKIPKGSGMDYFKKSDIVLNLKTNYIEISKNDDLYSISSNTITSDNPYVYYATNSSFNVEVDTEKDTKNRSLKITYSYNNASITEIYGMKLYKIAFVE